MYTGEYFSQIENVWSFFGFSIFLELKVTDMAALKWIEAPYG